MNSAPRESPQRLALEAVELFRVLKSAGAEPVIIGGHAPLFYRYATAAVGQSTPRLTLDLDVVLPARPRSETRILPVIREDPRLVVCVDRLRRVVSFQWLDRCESEMHRKGIARAPSYIELLTPLTGAPFTRGRDGNPGREKSPVEIEPDLRIEALRHLDLLLLNPFSVDVSRVDGLSSEVAAPFPIQVVHPLPFVVQKGLITPPREKDNWYVWDVATLVPATHAANWFVDARPRLARSDVQRIRKAVHELEARFGTGSGRGAQDVLREWDVSARAEPRPAPALINATVCKWLATAVLEPLEHFD